MALQPLHAEKPEMLVRAWQEYQFLSLEIAESYFEKVLSSKTDPEYLLEAKVGLAMVNQFNEQGADLDKAELLYQEVLEAEPSAETRQLVESFLADIHISRGDQESALKQLNALIEEASDSVIGQDALLRKTLLTMGAYGSEESLKAAEEVGNVIGTLQIEPTVQRPYLVPVLESLIGMIYFWADEDESAVKHLAKFTELGNAATTSYGTQATMLYRVARIYELDLKNPEKAGSFYRRLITEYPNSGTSYFALEKAIEFKAIDRSEVEAMRLPGLTSELLDELFSSDASRVN